MRNVHLTSDSENLFRAVYRPTARVGAPLIVAYVPDGISDEAVASLATRAAIPLHFGQRRSVHFSALGPDRPAAAR